MMPYKPVIFDRGSLHSKKLQDIAQEWRFWPYAEVEKALAMPTNLSMALQADNGDWAAVAMLNVAVDSADLLYIYTDAKFRRQGAAAQLLEAVFDELQKRRGIKRLLLEVRPQNAAAISLYKNLGFKHIDTRKRYYSDGDDALIFVYDL